MRSYRDADLERLIEIVRVHLEDYVTRHIGPWAHSESMLRTEMPAARDDIQVVEIGGEIVGFLWVDHRDDCLFVDEIHVVESARGRGLGRRLIEAAETQARHRGHREIRLAVFRDSPQVTFYARLGFIVIGEQHDRAQLHLSKMLQ
jgi:GNAT superfamily N-acetyltransferase